MNSSNSGFDFWSTYAIDSSNAVSLVARSQDRFASVKNLHSRCELLSQANAFQYKNEARTQHKKIILSRQYNDQHIQSGLEHIRSLGLAPSFTQSQMNVLPLGSFAVQFGFTLEKPWYSKDDIPFYVIDNPVRKDKVFKVPILPASSWKGMLRWSVRMDKGLLTHLESDPKMKRWKDDLQTIRIFGTEKGEQDEIRFRAGRLVTYPTYFDRIGMEMINPHSRKTKAGRNPITYEVVPPSAKGIFSLLYVPFDLIGQSGATIRKESLEDLELMSEAIQTLFLQYGISAKRTVGWGVAKDQFTREESRLLMSGIDLPVKGNHVKRKKPQRVSGLAALKDVDVSRRGNKNATNNDLGFVNFEELKNLVNRYREAANG